MKVCPLYLASIVEQIGVFENRKCGTPVMSARSMSALPRAHLLAYCFLQGMQGFHG